MKKICTAVAIVSLFATPAFAYGKLDEDTMNNFLEAPLVPYSITQEEEEEEIIITETEPDNTQTQQPQQTVQTPVSEPLQIRPEAIIVENVQYEQPPKWEDYVPEKYHYPRSDFTLGGSIAEFVIGIDLTLGVFTAPIGIPMVVHSSTKLKHIKYSKKKTKFEKGLAYGETIKDPTERKLYYKTLLEMCDLTEAKKQKIENKRKKRAEKQERILQEEMKKVNEL